VPAGARCRDVLVGSIDVGVGVGREARHWTFGPAWDDIVHRLTLKFERRASAGRKFLR